MYYAIFVLGLLALLFVGFNIGGVKVFKRKIMAALFTSILAVTVMNIMEPTSYADGSLYIAIMVYSAFIVPIIFIYGIIASIVSDRISSNAEKHSNLLSFILHILFGLLFILPYGILFESLPFLKLNIVDILTNPMTMLSIIFAFTFFAIDYILKSWVKKYSIYET